MTITTGVKDAMMNAQAITHVSLHTDFPGILGTNEVTGGAPAYARKAVTVGASSGGIRVLSGAVQFDVPACTVKWFGWWNNSTFLFGTPNGGAVPKNLVAVPSTDRIYSTDHQWSDGQKIVFFGIPPGGLTEGVTYFVRDSDADSFKVAATLAGSVIDLTSGASFGCIVVAITEDVYVTQGTHTLSAFTETVPD